MDKIGKGNYMIVLYSSCLPVGCEGGRLWEPSANAAPRWCSLSIWSLSTVNVGFPSIFNRATKSAALECRDLSQPMSTSCCVNTTARENPLMMSAFDSLLKDKNCHVSSVTGSWGDESSTNIAVETDMELAENWERAVSSTSVCRTSVRMAYIPLDEILKHWNGDTAQEFFPLDFLV